MRLTSNVFVVSTVALLSLMTPVCSADVAQITKPEGGQTLSPFDSIEVEWTILDSTGLGGVDCEIGLLHGQDAPSAPMSAGILQTGAPILSGSSNGQVQIPSVERRSDYFMELLSADGTVFGRSGTFSID